MPEPATAGAAAVQVPKAAELVAAQLRRQIVLGERVEGELFPPELKLMTELGVSRPTLRQALRILENEDLVRIHRGRNGGTRVSRPATATAGRYLNNLLLFQGATLDDVHTARLLLEPAAVADIAGTLDAAAIAELRSSIADAQRQTDAAEVRRIGARFHVQLVELTGNRSLTLFAELLTGLLDVPMERHNIDRLEKQIPSQAAGLLDHHSRVVDLIEAGAAREAARHWREHLDAVHQRLKETVNTSTVLDLEI
ncbi:FadR/GntR family transcriptional regulator [Pseudonocardia sp. GCM10023141]|uniref:FadR/GntR family transcriptional regulator n=1 Tax=Pseudonocardia sp. GCM10023141 TaxID=3252653 RepID=UPI003617F07B